RLLRGQEALTDYRHTPPTRTEPFLHLFFCNRCGVRAFSEGGVLPQFGGSFHAVNIACLDDATDDELASAPVHYVDGRANAWDRSPEHRYLSATGVFSWPRRKGAPMPLVRISVPAKSDASYRTTPSTGLSAAASRSTRRQINRRSQPRAPPGRSTDPPSNRVNQPLRLFAGL